MSLLLENTDYFASLESFEGIPDFFDARAIRKPAALRDKLHNALDWTGVMLPGVALALLLAWFGSLFSELFGRLAHLHCRRQPDQSGHCRRRDWIDCPEYGWRAKDV